MGMVSLIQGLLKSSLAKALGSVALKVYTKLYKTKIPASVFLIWKMLTVMSLL